MLSKFIQGYGVASRYVEAINDLPPTYDIEDKMDSLDHPFTQFFPDPISNEELKKKLDNADKCEREWKQWCKDNKK